jgi:DNA-binding MarR family transcriptional regulator
MMPEPKGRSGKKPKYQIADIGGADLTSEDISTERVLNFLIRGEATPPKETESSDAVVTEDSASDSPLISSQPIQNIPSSASLPSSEPVPKKSLAHLFERASSGGNLAKDLPLQLPVDERAEASPATPFEIPQPTLDSMDVVSEADAVAEPTTLLIGQAAPVSEPSEPIALTSPELAHYIELWKNFYRLKSGEVDALSVMYRSSHEKGRDECYIKMRNLAEMSNLTYRYCQKVVRSLEQLGWITKLRDYDPSDQRGVLYRVNLKPSAPLLIPSHA